MGPKMKFIFSPFFKDSQICECVGNIKNGTSVIGKGFGYVADPQRILCLGQKPWYAKHFSIAGTLLNSAFIIFA